MPTLFGIEAHSTRYSRIGLFYVFEINGRVRLLHESNSLMREERAVPVSLLETCSDDAMLAMRARGDKQFRNIRD